MASKSAAKGNKATRNDKPSETDCEHTVAMTTTGNSAPLGRSVAHSPLFKLSAELRNTIYSLVLVNDEDYGQVRIPVLVDKTSGIPEPPLLLSSKIIRSEASGIFYYENNFDCSVDNYNPAAALLLQSKFKMPLSEHPMYIEFITRRRGIRSRDTWKNLVLWIHLYHQRKIPSLLLQSKSLTPSSLTREPNGF